MIEPGLVSQKLCLPIIPSSQVSQSLTAIDGGVILYKSSSSKSQKENGHVVVMCVGIREHSPLLSRHMKIDNECSVNRGPKNSSLCDATLT